MDDGDLLGSKRKIHNCETLSLTLTRRPLRENSWVRETLHPDWSHDLLFRRRFRIQCWLRDANLRSNHCAQHAKKPIASTSADFPETGVVPD